MTYIIVTIICCITIVICRLIQAHSYREALEAEHRLYSTEILDIEDDASLKKSPYGLVRDMHEQTQTWGYVITEKGDKLKSSEGYYQILPIDAARRLINELEDIGGYKRTKF